MDKFSTFSGEGLPIDLHVEHGELVYEPIFRAEGGALYKGSDCPSCGASRGYRIPIGGIRCKASMSSFGRERGDERERERERERETSAESVAAAATAAVATA